MKIAYDSEIFIQQRYGGISRYYCSIAKAIHNLAVSDVRIISPLHLNKYLDDVPRVIHKGLNIGMVGARKPFENISRWIANETLHLYRPDVVHETYYPIEYSKRPSCKNIITIHDMIFEKFPEIFENADVTIKAKLNAILRADHIICVSENTKRDLLDIYNIDNTKVSVVHHGVCKSFYSNSSSLNASPFEPYILYVGSRGAYKNFIGLLEACHRSSRIINDFRIICFGGGGLTQNEREICYNYGYDEKHLICLDGAEEDLLHLYKNAACFIYPSFYEGFGMPLLEAMASGCPVICSNTSSIPEVVGAAAVMFNPYDIDEMVNKLEYILYSESVILDLKSKGVEQSMQFSWEKAAIATLDVYNS